MNENKFEVFTHADFGTVRAMFIDNKTYFAGKDVAEILGYPDADKALTEHVDEEDKLNIMVSENNQEEETVFINISGLIRLRIISNLSNTFKEEFCHWLILEVSSDMKKKAHQSAYASDPEEFYHYHNFFSSDRYCNMKKRLKLDKIIKELCYEYCEKYNAADKIEDYDESEAVISELDSTIKAKIEDICKVQKALCYPAPRNEWFRNFVKSFEIGRLIYLSEKQYNVFSRYCKYVDGIYYRDSYYCCRVDDLFVELRVYGSRWGKPIRTVTITKLNAEYL